MNDDADLDHLFADMEEDQETVCEVEIILNTKEGRIDTVLIALLDQETQDARWGLVFVTHWS